MLTSSPFASFLHGKYIDFPIGVYDCVDSPPSMRFTVNMTIVLETRLRLRAAHVMHRFLQEMFSKHKLFFFRCIVPCPQRLEFHSHQVFCYQ